MGSAWSDPAGQRPKTTQVRVPAISLATLLPGVISAIPEDERAIAERVLLAQRLSGRDEDLGNALAAAPDDAFGFLLAEGIVLKETVLAARSALEVLTAGDILAPPLKGLHQQESRAVSRYLAHGAVSLAVLGQRVRAASRKWPVLADDLHGRWASQSHRASAHAAMLHASRVEDRIVLLFADLGERCGRMTPDGVVVDIQFTHELIGRLVGAQRPTVSLALQNLADARTVCRIGTRGWLLPQSSGA